MVRKTVLSVVVWLAVTLLVAAGLEIAYGVPRPGFVPLITLLVAGPVLWRIWRRT